MNQLFTKVIQVYIEKTEKKNFYSKKDTNNTLTNIDT